MRKGNQSVISIISDELGSVWHSPAFLSNKEKKELYTSLRDEIEWEQPIVKLYGKTHYPKRGIYAVSDIGAMPYRFSGDAVIPHPWKKSLLKLKGRIEVEFGITGLNFALLNYYHGGASKLGYHSDDERDMQPKSPIVCVVLGSGRDFLIKPNSSAAKKKFSKVVKTYVDAGDILTMEGRTQSNFKHSIPSRVRAGPRISITYRKMKVHSGDIALKASPKGS